MDNSIMIGNTLLKMLTYSENNPTDKNLTPTFSPRCTPLSKSVTYTTLKRSCCRHIPPRESKSIESRKRCQKSININKD